MAAPAPTLPRPLALAWTGGVLQQWEADKSGQTIEEAVSATLPWVPLVKA